MAARRRRRDDTGVIGWIIAFLIWAPIAIPIMLIIVLVKMPKILVLLMQLVGIRTMLAWPRVRLVFYPIIVVAGSAVSLALAIVIGALYGVWLSIYHFFLSSKASLFIRSKNIEDNAQIDYFDFHGDGFVNVYQTCTKAFYETFVAAAKWDRFTSESWFISNIWDTLWKIFNYGMIGMGRLTSAICILLLTVVLYSVFFSIWFMYLVTTLLMKWFEGFVTNVYGLFNICKHCHKRIDLPTYKCPHCGTLHRHLTATVKFGLFFRTCKCGHRLPVSRYTGRNNLPSFCPNPNCGLPLSSQDAVPLSIAILGGPSSGKTQLLLDMIAVLRYRVLSELGLTGQIPEDHVVAVDRLLQMFDRGETPQITRDSMIEAVCIELKSTFWSYPHRLYLYDPPGESFRTRRKVSEHKYYENMVAAVFVLDPSTLEEVLQDYERNGVEFQIPQRGAMPPEESLERWLLSMEQDFPGVVHKSVCSVVINKTDEPSFFAITGLKCGASDKECRKFLRKYGCTNFISTLENNFKKVNFFSASFVGDKADGEAFKPVGVSKLVATTLNDSFVARSQKHIRRLIGKLLMVVVPMFVIASIFYLAMFLYSNRLVVDNEEWRWEGPSSYQERTLLRYFRTKEYAMLPNSLDDIHTDNPELLFYMGCVCDSTQREFGRSESCNDKNAFEMYERAANQGFAPAMVNLCMMYANGRGCDKDVAKAYDWCIRAMNLGYPRAYFWVGLNYRDGLWSIKNPSLAAEYFKKASSKGYLKGRLALGEILLNGDDGVRKDVERGLKLITQAAEAGLSDAQERLGALYLRKDGPVNHDVKLAEYWLKKSADNGSAEGCALLGAAYLTNKEFTNNKNGITYLKKGAESGNLKAARLLALIYEKGYTKNGYSIHRNLDAALKWFKVAAEIDSAYNSDVRRVLELFREQEK